MMRRERSGLWLATAVACLWAPLLGFAAGEAAAAKQILEATGVKGGLVIHIGCGDGKLTAALRANDSYSVHGLDADAKHVAAARKNVAAAGLYGKVAIDRLAGTRLPYVDNLANLVVASVKGQVSSEEIARVLAPRGKALVRSGSSLDTRPGRRRPALTLDTQAPSGLRGWSLFTKPVPREIDDWTHYLHDASNNAVSQDYVAGPPRRMQWLGSPRWARHHDHMSSLSSLVSAHGRLFYIFDEGSTASVVLPSHWFLIGRDAFNGTILWKRPIQKWFTQLWPLKSGPAMLTRRLVAVGDEVYVTLGLDAPVSALDAATGKTLRTYKGTRHTDEILAHDGVLFLAVNKKPEIRWGGSRASTSDIRRQVRDPRWASADSTVVAIKADTGATLWTHDATLSASTLAADAQRVYFHDGQKIVALDRRTGKQAWVSEAMPVWAPKQVQSYFVPILVVYKDVVLWTGGETSIPHRASKDAMYGLDAKTGKKLWSAPHGPSGYQSAEDLLVAGGLVWSGATVNGGVDGIFRGYDPRTGELRKEFAPDTPEGTYWFHHRCHRGKATDRYLLMSRTGIEFIDIEKKTWDINHWTRGACLTGVMPCNGLIYCPPHDCACYPEAKTFGFNALAPARRDEGRGARDEEPAARLERGPAYGSSLDTRHSTLDTSAEWPTYRHDAARSGFTKTSVPAELKPAWERKLGGRLSSVVVADGKLFVASVDEHSIHALDAKTGEPAWSYTAGGRVDSPPTIWQGLCLFGSADGHVYCLRAADGALAWRFLAAPVDQRQMAFEQVESVWPVHGSILVQNGAAYFTAGRSMFLDGGLRLYRLDARTGRVLSMTAMSDKDPEKDTSLQHRHKVLNMPVALPDVLSSDGKRVYMRSQAFDLEGKRQAVGPHSPDPAGQGSVQRGDEVHLFAPYGFLDSEWFHRSYWVYGRSFAGGHAGYYQAAKFTPAGRILAAGDKRVYGYARKPQYLRWTTPLEYHLFATSNEPPELPPMPSGRARRGSRATGSWIQVNNTESLNPTGKPLAVEALVRADKPNGVVVARGGPSQGYALFLKGGTPHFAIRSDQKIHQVAAKQKIVGQWTHLAGVLTADKQLELYVDGKLADSAKAGVFIAGEPAQDMQIGADADTGQGVADYTGPFPLTGLIDEVRVYHGSVTAAEVAKHCATPGDTAAAKAKLVLHFTFEKGNANDQSGSKNHGQLGTVKAIKGKAGNAMQFTGKAGGAGGRPRKSHFVEYQWSVDGPPLAVRAMVLAGKTLFIAGPPDVLDEDAAVRQLDDPRVVEALAGQDAALRGEKGALLLAVSTADGKTLAQRTLPSMPAWDAMAAAHGRLYMATTDGKIVCLAGVE